MNEKELKNSSQEFVQEQTDVDSIEENTEQEEQLIDIDNISFSTNEGQADYLWSVMKNEHAFSYKEGDENYDRRCVRPQSQNAEYGMTVMKDVKNGIQLPENQDKTVRDLLRMKQKNLEGTQEKRQLDLSIPFDDVIDSKLVADLETVKQLIDLLDIESHNRSYEIEQFNENAKDNSDTEATILTEETSSENPQDHYWTNEKGRTVKAENINEAEQIFKAIDSREVEEKEITPSPEERTHDSLKALVDLWNSFASNENDPTKKEDCNYEAEEAIKVLNEFEAAIGQKDKDGNLLSSETVLKDNLSEAEVQYALVDAKYASTNDSLMKKNLLRQKQRAFKKMKYIHNALSRLEEFTLN